MAKLTVKSGTASRSEYIFIQDSTSTTGAGLTGLVFNSAGLTCYYVTERGTPTPITLVTLASATAAYSSGGFVAVDGTNMPGLYRFDLPSAVLSGNKGIVYLKGATNMVPVLLEYDVVAFDTQDTVRLGLTAMPNVASGSAGAIITSGTGIAQLATTSGNVTAGTVSDKTGYSLANSQTFSTTGSVGSVTGSVNSVVSAVTAGTVSDKTGYSLAASQTFSTTGSVGSVTASVTAGTVSDKTGYSLANSQTFSTTGSVGSVTGSVGSVTASVTAGTVSDKTGYSLATAPPTASAISAAVWGDNVSTYTGTGTFGYRILRSDSTSHSGDVQVSGNGSANNHNRIDADIHAIASDATAATNLKNLLPTAGAIAGTVSGIANITFPTNFSALAITSPNGYVTSTNGGGGGGGSTVTVRMGPYTFSTPNTRAGESISTMVGASHDIEFQMLDALGNAVDSTGATVTAKVYSLAGTLVDTYTATMVYSSAGRGYFTIDSTVTANAGTYRVTITRSTGIADVTVVGPVTLYVREV